MTITSVLVLAACGTVEKKTESTTGNELTTEKETAEVETKEDTETLEDAEKETEEVVTETPDVTDADTGILTADEEEILSLLEEDITVITDETYAEIVEMQYHPEEFTGKVYQLEGVYTMEHNGDTPYIYRTLVNGKEEIFCGLPLVYSDKNMEEGTWVKATGIVNVHEIEGENQIAFEIVAIQSMEESGNLLLEWSGSEHTH